MYCAIVAHDYLHSRVRVVFYLHLVYAIFSCDYMDVSSLKVGVVVLIATGEDGRERNKDARKIPKAGPEGSHLVEALSNRGAWNV